VRNWPAGVEITTGSGRHRFRHIVAGVYSPWNARFSQTKTLIPQCRLSRKDWSVTAATRGDDNSRELGLQSSLGFEPKGRGVFWPLGMVAQRPRVHEGRED
jgi:hypothetical protein